MHASNDPFADLKAQFSLVGRRCEKDLAIGPGRDQAARKLPVLTFAESEQRVTNCCAFKIPDAGKLTKQVELANSPEKAFRGGKMALSRVSEN